jgi:hypothetical protein
MSGYAHVRNGSNSEVRMFNREVGFALNNGHRQPSVSGPKSAKTGSGRYKPYEEKIT